jgi:NAD(P)-dependent dehydrogenase (short-subunit alcohol dehydrogenase family)
MTRAMTGKNCIITGGSGGIGAAIAARLIADGADVTILARDTPRLDAAARRLGADALPCDLARLEDVRAAAARLAAQPIDVLVLNAAIIAPRRSMTLDGLESTLAVNHLAPYLLTRLLVPHLTASARIVVLGADPAMLARTPVDLDDLQSERTFSSSGSYMRSKNMNVMFAYALARRLGEGGVLVNAAHPGVIRTDLASNTTGLLRLMTTLARPFVPDANSGADTPAWLASSAEVTSTGGFYKKRKRVETAGHTRDPGRQEALWQTSARLVGLDP